VVQAIGPFQTIIQEDIQTYKIFNTVPLFLCPHPTCRNANDPPYEMDTSKPTMTCPHCKTMFCTECQMPAHIGVSCAYAGKHSVRAGEVQSRQYIQDTTRPCPNPGCQNSFSKNKACYHMECPACDVSFCWICGISRCSHNKCHLMGRVAPWSHEASVRFKANPAAVADWRRRYANREENGGQPLFVRANVVLYDDGPQYYPPSAYSMNMYE
jgi:hypothetical protein